MTSAMTISSIVDEPNVTSANELNDKEKFAKRFQPTNTKRNDQSTNQKQTSSSSPSTDHPLRADDIKDYRLWSLVSLILCFFLVAPCIAFYHSRRIRKMKNNQELVRAKIWSDRVNNLLIISNIIGIIIWVAIIFVIAALFIMGAVY